MAERYWLSMLHCFAQLPSANSQGVFVMLAKYVASGAWAALLYDKAEISIKKLECLLLR